MALWPPWDMTPPRLFLVVWDSVTLRVNSSKVCFWPILFLVACYGAAIVFLCWWNLVVLTLFMRPEAGPADEYSSSWTLSEVTRCWGACRGAKFAALRFVKVSLILKDACMTSFCSSFSSSDPIDCSNTGKTCLLDVAALDWGTLSFSLTVISGTLNCCYCFCFWLSGFRCWFGPIPVNSFFIRLYCFWVCAWSCTGMCFTSAYFLSLATY